MGVINVGHRTQKALGTRNQKDGQAGAGLGPIFRPTINSFKFANFPPNPCPPAPHPRPFICDGTYRISPYPARPAIGVGRAPRLSDPCGSAGLDVQDAVSCDTVSLVRRGRMDDFVLLSRYVETGCQESFQEIVTRHSGWVFSLSLRAVRDRHLAEDVTQAVFIVLARKARTIREGTPLSGWLFKVSRFAVSDALKRRTRIKNRENRFAEFFKATSNFSGGPIDGDNLADGISETLDEAVACLSDSDRQAILLRFYEHKSLAEIGVILDISEEAAKKRVARAIERLRKYFSTRGIMASFALMLLLLSRHSAEAAGGVPYISAAAAPAIANTIAEGALKLMAHANARLLGAILAGSIALMIAVPTLGGALVRTIVATTAPAPQVAAVPKALPEIPYHTEPAQTPKLPAEPRFADLYIAYKGETLWRSDAYTAPAAPPFILINAEKHDKPYAIAVDNRGNYFLKPLEPSFLQSPVIRQSAFDYDNGPVEPSQRVREMLSVIDSMPAGSSSAGHHGHDGANAPTSEGGVGSAHGDSGGILPQIDVGHMDGSDWHQLQQKTNEEGITEIRPSGWNSIFNFNTSGLSDRAPIQIEVPEPAGALLLMISGAGALILRRRRRK